MIALALIGAGQIIMGTLELTQLARTTPDLLRMFPGVEHLVAVDELNGSARSIIVVSVIALLGVALTARHVRLGRTWARTVSFTLLGAILGLEFLQIGGDSSLVVAVDMLANGSAAGTEEAARRLLYPAWLPWAYFAAEILFMVAAATAAVCLVRTLPGEYFQRKNAPLGPDDPRVWDVKAISKKINSEKRAPDPGRT